MTCGELQARRAQLGASAALDEQRHEGSNLALIELGVGVLHGRYNLLRWQVSVFAAQSL